MYPSTSFRELLVADVLILLDPSRADPVQRFLDRRRRQDARTRGAFLASLAAELGIPLEEAQRAEREIQAVLSRASEASASSAGEDGANEQGAAAELDRLPDLDPSRYTAIERIASGGMGTVYAAYDTVLDRRVALKTITVEAAFRAADPGDAPADTRATRRSADLLREARTVSTLTHPGIVPVYDLGRTPRGIPFYSMRYVQDGRTLLHAIEDAPTLAARLELLDPVLDACDALRFAHAHDVLHRDVKPSNIALGAYGEVLLLDWGLASRPLPHGLTSEPWQHAAGTPAYAAPEMLLRAAGEPGPPIDVYGVGATLFHVLVGRPPLDCRSLAEALTRLDRGEPRPPHEINPAIPREVSQICVRSMAPDPAQRHASVEELARDLRRWRDSWRRQREVTMLTDESETLIASASQIPPIGAFQLLDRAQKLLVQASQIDSDHLRLDELVRRCEEARTQTRVRRDWEMRRRVVGRVAVLVAVLAALALGAFTWLLDDERRRTRGESQRADGLARFMLEDLHARLEPIGRLDLLGPVAEQALDYYQRMREGTGVERIQRARALRQVGQVLRARGDLGAARRAFEFGISTLRPLTDADPPNETARSLFTALLDSHASASMDGGNRAMSTASWLEAEERLWPAIEELPRSSRDRLVLASCLFGRSRLALSAWQSEEARRLLEFALAALGDAVPGAGESMQSSVLRVRVRGQLAQLRPAPGSAQEVLRAVDPTVASARALCERHPHDARARAALADVLSRVAELLRSRGYPRAALELAIESQDVRHGLAEADPTNASKRLEFAHARQSVAVIQDLLGASNSATAAADQVRALARDLSVANPRNLVWRAHLARAERDVARLALERGADARAAQANAAARSIWSDLTRADPENVEWRLQLALALADGYECASRNGERQVGLAGLECAMAELDGLVAALPQEPELVHAAEATRLRLGRAHFVADRIEGAEQGFRRAADRVSELVRADPKNLRYLETLASACRLMAHLERHRNLLDRALAWERRAADALATLVDTEPADCTLAARVLAAETELRLCDLLSSFGRDAEAADRLARGRALWDAALRASPDSERVQRARAAFLVHEARHHGEAGDAAAARTNWRAALVARQSLATGSTAERSHWLDLVDTLEEFAALEHAARRYDAASSLHERASAVWDELLRGGSQDAALLERAAYAHGRWGTTLQAALQPRRASELFARAHALHVRAVGLSPGRAQRHAWYDRMLRESRVIARRVEPDGAAEQVLLARWLYWTGDVHAALPYFEAALTDESVRADLEASNLWCGVACAARVAATREQPEQEALWRLAFAWFSDLVARNRAQLAEAERALSSDPNSSSAPNWRRQRTNATLALAWFRDDAPWIDALRERPEFLRLLPKLEDSGTR